MAAVRPRTGKRCLKCLIGFLNKRSGKDGHEQASVPAQRVVARPPRRSRGRSQTRPPRFFRPAPFTRRQLMISVKHGVPAEAAGCW